MDNPVVKTQKDLLKERIPYDATKHQTQKNYENIIDSLLEDSKYIGLSLKYPFTDYSDKSLPSKYDNWQIRCCQELYKLAGNENVKSYSENGLNWTMFRDGLSLNLINEITPNVGVLESDDTNV